MKLSEWLTENRVSRAEFARQVGVSGAAITQWCDGSIYPSREMAERIVEVTNGSVTPNDFLGDGYDQPRDAHSCA